jgi:multidrug efflux pump subunit AcrA (membrane-fusion protein)
MNQESNPHSQPAAASHETAPEATPLSPRKAMAGVVVVLLILVVLAAVGILRRIHAGTFWPSAPTLWPRPRSTIATAKAGAPVETLVLPGNVTAFTDSPIYARTDGYLDHWYFDIGARVKKGALLAVISTPELDKQVSQAESDLATAEPPPTMRASQAERYSGLVKSNAVSQQDTDTFVNQAAATAAAVKSAQANLQRLANCNRSRRSMRPSMAW